MEIFYGKIDESFISRKDTGIGGGVLKESASYETIYVQGHCAQGVLKFLKKMYIAATVNSPEATEAYFY